MKKIQKGLKKCLIAGGRPRASTSNQQQAELQHNIDTDSVSAPQNNNTPTPQLSNRSYIDHWIREEDEVSRRFPTAAAGCSFDLHPRLQQSDSNREDDAFVIVPREGSVASPANYDTQTTNQSHERSDACDEDSFFYTELVSRPSGACAASNRPPGGIQGKPYLEIVEQPQRVRRFRYPTDVKSAGPLRGVNYREQAKSYPKLKIGNYHGRALVVVSLVALTKDGRYLVHPAGFVPSPLPATLDVGHATNLIHTQQVVVTEEESVFEFNHLCIVTLPNKNIKDALTFREEHFRELGMYPVPTGSTSSGKSSVDPLINGFSHKSSKMFQSKRLKEYKDIMKKVRLCFHVLEPDTRQQLAEPVVSDDIMNSKVTGSPKIKKTCKNCISGSPEGGTELMIFCSPVDKDDIEVIFYLEKEKWEAAGTLTFYNQSCISCLTPAFKLWKISEPVTVKYELRLPSDDAARSKAWHFTYIPDRSTEIDENIKRKKTKKMNPNLLQYLDWTPVNISPDVDFPDLDFNRMSDPIPGPSHSDPAVPGIQPD